MQKKIAIYMRVSTRDQSIFGNGLDVQEIKCKQYLDLYEYGNNYQIELYKDDGYSAKSLERPQMQKLMNDVRTGNIEVIIVYKLDRLVRSVVDTYKLIQELQQYNCQLIAVLDKIDISCANGRMIAGILAVFAQWERETIVERTNDGLESMAQKGKYPSPRCPFGWNKSKDKYLSINEENAKIVNEMADLVIEGMSCKQLVYYLKENYKIIKNDTTIKKILHSERLIGVFEYHQKKYYNVFPPIMSKSKFERLQKCLKYRSNVDMEKYFFYNIVYCTCGEKCDNRSTKKNLTRGRYRYYYYYECPVCHKRIGQVQLVNECLVPMLLHDAKKQMNKTLEDKKNKLLKIDKQLQELFVKYEEGELDITTYTNNIKRLKNKKKKLQAQIIGLQIDEKNAFLNASDEEKNAYIKGKLRRVFVNHDLKIVTHFEWKDEQIR